MKVSVIMIDGGFRENAFAAEYFSRQDFSRDEYEIIWVEFYDKVHPDVLGKPDIKVITLEKKGLYHSSYCFNAGIREAEANILVLVDADVMVEEDFLSILYDEHCKSYDVALYFHRFCQNEEIFDEENCSFDYVKASSRFLVSNIENHGGCLSVRKPWLLEIGGYEQHRAFATGNHANGRDVYTRLKNLGLCVKWHPERYLYHPWHPGTQGQGRDKRRTKWQQDIIRYKSTSLMTVAFEGINGLCPPKYCVPPPPLGDPDEDRMT